MKTFHHLEANPEWAFAGNNNQYSHGYHRYPAKFISSIAHKLIDENSRPGNLVCDPFGGCGTTLVEAKLMGRKSVGFDINPVAKLITEVKSKAIHPDILDKAYQRLNDRINADNWVKNDYSSTHERIRYWFNEESYLALQHIYRAILKEDDDSIQKFFVCAFSHCLKNSSRWLMKSIKPTIDKNKPRINTIQNFVKHLKGMIKKNASLYGKLKAKCYLSLDSKIHLADITDLNQQLLVDLIVTSPPYVTSYEYGDLHQLTLLWLGHHRYKGWQKYWNNFRGFKGSFIGSSIQNNTTGDMGSDIADSIVADLQKVDKGLAKKVSTYFAKMYQAYSVMNRFIKKGKKVCIVIGNTKLKGVEILNAEVCHEQLLNIGLRADEVIKRNANTNKMIAPYRDKATGKFTSNKTKNKTIAYHEEYIVKVKNE